MSSDNLDFSLSIYNLKDFPFQKYEKNFSFFVNGKEYKTNRFIADLLSPIIRNSHFNDETLDTFSFNSKYHFSNIDDGIDYFNDFLNLCQFETVNIDTKRRKLYSDYFCHLGNSEEYIRLRSNDCEEISSKDNAIDNLLAITEFLSSNQTIKEAEYDSYKSTIHKLVTFIASNFEDVDKGKLNNLDYDIIEEIISNKSLKLREEDNLLHFILDLYELDRDYSCLFKYVIFSNITDNTFKHFIERLEIDNIDSNVWKLICNRLLVSQSDSSKQKNHIKNRYIEDIQELYYQNGKEFQGIMNYLTKKTGGNIHDNETIKINSNSIGKQNYHPKNLVDYDKDNYYYSNNDILSNICFDFKDRKVNISEYSIKSYNQESYTGHLKDWKIDVSNDGENWTTIDTHENDQTLNGPNIIGRFEVQKKDDEFYRFVRFRQTGNNWNGRNCNFIYLYCIEFYGKLKQSST